MLESATGSQADRETDRLAVRQGADGKQADVLWGISQLRFEFHSELTVGACERQQEGGAPYR